VAVTIVATAGAANANSFVTEAEFIAHLATRLNAHSGATVTGSTCSEDEKKALVESFRWFNTLAWLGTRTTAAQAGAWPREDALNPDAPNVLNISDLDELYFEDEELPARVRRGQMELAVEFLKAGTTDIGALPANSGVIEKTVDVLTTRWADPYYQKTGLARFPRVLDEIGPLLSATAGTLDVVRC
jgi:hypothetical protein